MKKSALLLLVLILSLTGCAPKVVDYVPTPGAEAVNFSAGFRVGQINDLSGFTWPPEVKDPLDLKEAMATALREKLKENNLAGEGKYRVDVDILKYAPGNAFARWLLGPFAGGSANTLLYAKAMIFDAKGVKAAEIPYNGEFGGFIFGSPGLYKDVFGYAAVGITSQLKGKGQRGKKSEAAPTESAYNFGS